MTVSRKCNQRNTPLLLRDFTCATYPNEAQLRLQFVDTYQVDNMSKIQILIWICIAAMINPDCEAALILYRRAKPQQPLETVSFLNDVNIIF